MLIALCLSALLQPAQIPETDTISHRPAWPALAAKAPGKPEYGIHITSPQGQFVFTNLRYTALNPTGAATLYRVTGPAGMGPYRLGVALRFWYSSESYNVHDPQRIRTYGAPRFEILKAEEGGAAKLAGLDEGWFIVKVDGKDFGWDVGSLIAYLSTRPTVEVLAYNSKGWGSKKERAFQVQLRKTETPVDPADGVLTPERVETLQPMLKDPGLWSELITLRSASPRFTPLPVDFPDKRLWAVRGLQDPHPVPGEQAGLTALEFWGEDPASGPKQHHPAALWEEPEDGLRPGRPLQVEDHWYRIQDVAVDTNSGRLLKLALQPWAVEVPALLVGSGQTQHLGPHAALAQKEAFEQQANEALIEWKIRTLPGLLATQGLGATEDMVVRLEKGMLKLDLEGKGIRARLDAQARTEAERKAASELSAKDGKPAPVAGPPATESERLADLLDQRKAILMAILGSAKQALSNLRR